MAIEPACAALAAQRVTAEQIAELRSNLDQSDQVPARRRPDLHCPRHRIPLHRRPSIRQSASIPCPGSNHNPETDARQVIHRLPGHLPIAQARHEVVFAAIAAKDEGGAQRMVADFPNRVDDRIRRVK